MTVNGWIQLNRSANTYELLKKPKVFALLSQIALRARRTNQLDLNGLSVGEAFIGDHITCGLTRQEYRTAKKTLEKLGLATFKPTNKGTIATILDSSIYDINLEIDQPASKPTTNQPTTNSQPSTNQQATTNNNFKKEKKDKETPITGTYAVDDDIFPEILKKKFGQIGMTPKGAIRLYNNCDQNTDIMLEWVIWGISQSNAKNIAGLIINESKRNSKPPFLSKKYQTEINNLLEKESYSWAKKVFGKLKEKKPEATGIICRKITNSELGYDRPKNKNGCDQTINAIENNKYDLMTGDKIENN